MIDTEVERLRRLRASALKMRAIARALSEQKCALNDPLMNKGACAAWRVARTVSGRLRAHPFQDYQKDASLDVLVANALAARLASFGASSRVQALKALEGQIKSVSRQLDDARALAWSGDLSDILGRSQREMRSLAADTERALYGACEAYAQSTMPTRATVAGGQSTDWPFVGL